MPKRMRLDTAAQLRDYQGTDIGRCLGAAVVEANLPVTYVAKVFLVSRNTVQGWFFGAPIKPKHRPMVEALTALIKGDLSVGELPAKTLKEAKLYLDEITGASGHDCSK